MKSLVKRGEICGDHGAFLMGISGGLHQVSLTDLSPSPFDNCERQYTIVILPLVKKKKEVSVIHIQPLSQGSLWCYRRLRDRGQQVGPARHKRE